MRKAKLVIALVSGFALSFGAIAADQATDKPSSMDKPAAPRGAEGRPAPSSIFEQLDADHDGFVTAKEAERSATAKANFKAMDVTGDGRISAEEWAEFMRR